MLFEDEHLLALDKPSGIHTAPVRPHDVDTLLAAAIAHDPRIAAAGPPLEGGLVHRLDRGTSGVVLFAKDAMTRARLREAFSAHSIEKRYQALVLDVSGLPAGLVIDAPLSSSGPRVRFDPTGLSAVTIVRSIEPFSMDRFRVEVSATTGRRHQIRVHLALRGAPILGDELYGLGPGRLALHACWIQVPRWPAIASPWPSDLATER